MSDSKEIPVEEKVVPCRFGDRDPAIARFKFSEGCACFPDDREQDLCIHHAYKSEPLGTMEPVLIYDPSGYKLLCAPINKKL